MNASLIKNPIEERGGNTMDTMKRVRTLGVVLAAAGLAVGGVGLFYGVPTAIDGLDSAQALYEAQGVTLKYNENGELVDHGTVEGAQDIMALLEDEWDYPVNHGNLDPDDPLVNTRDELMYQYATITTHVLHGEATVKLTEEQVPIEYGGITYTEPGEYKIPVGKYYAELSSKNPIEGQLRASWSPQALSLLGTLAAGHANQAAGELALATSLGIGSLGLLFAAAGGGLVWASYGRDPEDEKQEELGAEPVSSPVPEPTQ